MKNPVVLSACALGLVGLLLTHSAAAQVKSGPTTTEEASDGGLDVGWGLDAASGNYGGNVRIDERSMSLVLRYKTGRWGTKVSIPYLRVTGPADVVLVNRGTVACDDDDSKRSRGKRGGNHRSLGKSGSLDDCDSSAVGATAAAERITRKGLGDVQLEISYELPELRDGGPVLELVSKIKLGTASTRKGLGTGKNSYALQVDAAQPLGAWEALGGVGYRAYQKIPGITLKNAPFFALGVKRELSDATSAKVVYEHRRPVEVGTPHAAELTATVESVWRKDWRVEAYVFKGLTNASADAGAGLVVMRRF